MDDDPVTHPAHYCLASGFEIHDAIEGLPFYRGAAIKYAFRAGKKHPGDIDLEIEDIRKGIESLRIELERLYAMKKERPA